MRSFVTSVFLTLLGVACAVVLGYDEYCSTHPKQEKYLAVLGWLASSCGLLLLGYYFFCRLLLCNTR